MSPNTVFPVPRHISIVRAEELDHQVAFADAKRDVLIDIQKLHCSYQQCIHAIELHAAVLAQQNRCVVVAWSDDGIVVTATPLHEQA
jgi:hypothetical protein